MSTVDNLKSILIKQREVISSLETEIGEIETSDLVTENKKLKEELEKSKDSLEKVKSHNIKIAHENKSLRNTLYEQFYNEKVQLINTASKKIDIYFKSNIEGEVNRLKSFEASVKRQIDKMEANLRTNNISIEDDIYKELEDLRKDIDIKITSAREELARNTGAFSEKKSEEFEKLKSEQVTEEEINARVKQNNIESFIGLNIINKLGILLLIIGVITASQFTYFKLPDMLKSIFTFTFGVVLLISGELLNRKKPNVFSLGITSGGIAILYVALTISFFKFGVLEMYPALALCILITVGAFVLSQRYNSQTISAFAMIGGYLPIFSIAGNKTILYGAMVYFVILNILALSISVNKKWTATAYIGFALNVVGSIYISFIMLKPINNAFSLDDFITLTYIVFAFIIYTLIPVLGSFRKKLSFKISDIILLSLNTVISSLILYSLFYIMDLSDFTGVLAIVFACIYLSLGKFVENYMLKEKKAIALFYITGLTFAVLVIPFQFGKVWLSLGWLVEGIALLSYGIHKELKEFKKAGVVIALLCLASFIIFDVTAFYNHLFVYKYLAITVGSIIVLASLMHKRILSTSYALWFKYLTIINIWFFSLYISGYKLDEILIKSFKGSSLNLSYLTSSAMILMSFIVAYVIPRIKILCDAVMKGISVVIYLISLFALFLLNFSSPITIVPQEVPMAISIIGTAELIVIVLLSILAVRELVLCLVIEGKMGIEWYPLIISTYFVVVLTQNLITQFNLEFNNAIISIIYLLTAFAWITFGFMKRYAFIRRFGLGLSILSVAKLFIIDLSFLSQGYRIVSYFVFGMTLLLISFVYQYFSKRIDSKVEVIAK